MFPPLRDTLEKFRTVPVSGTYLSDHSPTPQITYAVRDYETARRPSPALSGSRPRTSARWLSNSTPSRAHRE